MFSTDISNLTQLVFLCLITLVWYECAYKLGLQCLFQEINSDLTKAMLNPNLSNGTLWVTARKMSWAQIAAAIFQLYLN